MKHFYCLFLKFYSFKKKQLTNRGWTGLKIGKENHSLISGWAYLWKLKEVVNVSGKIADAIRAGNSRQQLQWEKDFKGFRSSSSHVPLSKIVKESCKWSFIFLSYFYCYFKKFQIENFLLHRITITWQNIKKSDTYNKCYF